MLGGDEHGDAAQPASGSLDVPQLADAAESPEEDLLEKIGNVLVPPRIERSVRRTQPECSSWKAAAAPGCPATRARMRATLSPMNGRGMNIDD
jgi:hypothetical protein